MAKSDPEYVVTTRAKIPPYPEHPTLQTTHSHVILRPFRTTDLHAFHELRTQSEVMKWTSTGKIDPDVNMTKSWMSMFMDLGTELKNWSPETFPGAEFYGNASAQSPRWNFVITYKKSLEQAKSKSEQNEEVIGVCGCLVLHPEPVCGYMIRKEFWGQGIATAALRAVLESYWNLERTSVKLPWDPRLDKHKVYQYLTDEAEGAAGTEKVVRVREVLGAEIVMENVGSQRVLEKCGFQRKSSYVLQENGGEIELVQYFVGRPPT